MPQPPRPQTLCHGPQMLISVAQGLASGRLCGWRLRELRGGGEGGECRTSHSRLGHALRPRHRRLKRIHQQHLIFMRSGLGGAVSTFFESNDPTVEKTALSRFVLLLPSARSCAPDASLRRGTRGLQAWRRVEDAGGREAGLQARAGQTRDKFGTRRRPLVNNSMNNQIFS